MYFVPVVMVGEKITMRKVADMCTLATWYMQLKCISTIPNNDEKL